MRKKRLGLIAFIFVIVFSIAGCGQKEEATKDIKAKEETLLVYSGAGLKRPMKKIADQFSKDKGVKIEYVFAGSTQLLGQLQTSGKGDVFIVGSKNAYDSAKKQNLVGECKEVAYHTPAIITKKGNPKEIKTLNDLEKDGVKVILGDPKANAIGKTSEKIIEKNKLDGLEKNVQAKMATVNEVILHVVEGKADAAIGTKDSVYKNENVDVIEIPEDQNVDQILPIATVSASDKKDRADEFVEFVSSDEGKKIFEEFGFKPVK